MSVDLSELKRSEFPACVKQGLRKLEDILHMPNVSHQQDIQLQIMDHFIFFCRDSSSSKIRAVGPIEELVVVRELAQYLGKIVDAASRNSLFITLFHPSTHDPRTQHKLRILSALVSLAIATHNVSVLEATAVWMQQVCCLSTWSGEVCRGLVQDYFQLTPTAPQHFAGALRALPTMAPLFTANLITTLSQLYAKVGSGEVCEQPPDALVSTVVWWLQGNLGAPSHLALAPLTHPLPGVSLPMTAVPPIAPLMKWCVESPFFDKPTVVYAPFESPARRASLPKVIEAETLYEKNPGKVQTTECTDQYSKLHLSVIQTLQSVPSFRDRMTQKQVLCPKHVTSVVDAVCERIQNSSEKQSEAVNMSLDRLAQTILVALHTECLSGSLSDMWDALHRLPTKNRLITTLLSTREAR
ncbi:integrator complex subunit 15 [Palaemon carinicauda]|uniref:integrator complex subunit 15 n=1 Tax=Palaemon carinicauda TaxID=392227 RepID=UPI0035B612A1